MFVSEQGAQMEIWLKAKQSSNSNFEFLSFDSSLNPYYKLILNSIKTGKYVPKKGDEAEKNNSDDSDDGSDDGHYLHPSLMGGQNKTESISLSFASFPRFTDENDIYSQLVKSLRDKMPHISHVENNSVNEANKVMNEKVISTISGSLLPTPPPEVELIIEKLVQYVAKGGEEFENSVKKRGEERFEFLNPGNVYHAHYIRRKLFYLEEKRKAQAAQIAENKIMCQKEKQKERENIEIQAHLKTPVCFSITREGSNSRNSMQTLSTDDIASSEEKQSKEKDKDKKKTNSSNTALQDKLASAVRDKLAKEKQEERKRKAALFLSMVNNKKPKQEETSSTNENRAIETTSNSAFGPELPLETKNELSPVVTSPPRTPPIKPPSPKEKSPADVLRKNTELLKNNIVVLPFITSDKTIKKSHDREKHRHHHHHHRKHKRNSRSPSHRKASRSRSRSRSKSKSRSKQKSRLSPSKSHSRSRSRSKSKTSSSKKRR